MSVTASYEPRWHGRGPASRPTASARLDRVGLLCASSPEFAVAYLAVLGVGAVAAPVNPQSPLEELDQELSAVRPVAVVVGPADERAGEALAERGQLVLPAVDLQASTAPDSRDRGPSRATNRRRCCSPPAPPASRKPPC